MVLLSESLTAVVPNTSVSGRPKPRVPRSKQALQAVSSTAMTAACFAGGHSTQGHRQQQ